MKRSVRLSIAILLVLWNCAACASMQPQASAETQPLQAEGGAQSDSPQEAPAAAIEGGEAGAAAMSSVPLRFTPRNGLDVLDVVTEVERAFYLGNGFPLVAVLEIKANFSTVGRFSIASQYSSLAGFASAMQAQEAAYRWQAVNDSTLVVKPASGAELDKNVSNFAVGNKTACDILSELAVRLNPSQGLSGCVVRDTPVYVPARAAYDVMQQKISVSYAGTRSAQSTALDVLGRLDSAVGVSLYRWDSRLNLMWEVRW